MAKKEVFDADDFYPVTCWVDREVYEDFIVETKDEKLKIASMRLDRGTKGKLRIYYMWEVVERKDND